MYVQKFTFNILLVENFLEETGAFYYFGNRITIIMDS